MTREAVEKRSIFSKEKLCTLAKMSWRRFFAKPEEARAEVKPPAEPQARDTKLIATRMSPVCKISCICAPALMALTRFAVIKGITTSIMTSHTIRINVMNVGFLYSRTLFKSCFIIGSCHILSWG